MRGSRTVRFFSPTAAAAATAFLNRLDLHCFLPLASDRHNVQGLLASNATEGLFHRSCKTLKSFRGRSCGRRCSGLVRSSAETNLEGKPYRGVSGGKRLFLTRSAAGFGRRLAICWSQRLAEWVVGSWLPVAAYWIELGGRPSWPLALVTQTDSPPHTSATNLLQTSLTSNWERINVNLIRDSRQRRAIIAILPLDVLWTLSKIV